MGFYADNTVEITVNGVKIVVAKVDAEAILEANKDKAKTKTSK